MFAPADDHWGGYWRTATIPRAGCLRAPTTEQILGLFSFAERHELIQDGNTMQVFRRSVHRPAAALLTLLGVPEQALRRQ
jgi:hypothetical protein